MWGAVRSLGLQNVHADTGPIIRSVIGHSKLQRKFRSMTSCVATIIWCQHFFRALNGGSPTLWSQWLLLITSRAIRRGNFVNIRKSNKIIQPLAPHSKLSPHLHSLGCSQSISTPYRDSPPVLFVPHCHSPSVSFTCTLHPHSYPLVFLHQFPAMTFCWAYQLCSAYRAHCD